jgi:lipoprotein NlpD
VRRDWAVVVSAALLLGACTHARVVQREPGARPTPSPRWAPARPAISPLPASGVHVVSRGETLYGISFRYGLRFQDVAAWNGIGDPYLIEVGQRLRLSPARRGESPIAAAPRPLPPAAPRPAAPSAGAPSAPRPATAAPRPPSATPIVGAPAAPSPPSMPTGAMSWRWPVQGQVIGRYVAGDQTRQGIDIAGKGGQEVQAAADGVVVYSGAGLVGYGELIIVKHSDEWLSAYAHNERRLVAEGTRVSAGQVIARMGHTGAPRDMLHFEIRRNGKPVDPLGLLPRR